MNLPECNLEAIIGGQGLYDSLVYDRCAWLNKTFLFMAIARVKTRGCRALILFAISLLKGDKIAQHPFGITARRAAYQN
jgi:hypothetical protein